MSNNGSFTNLLHLHNVDNGKWNTCMYNVSSFSVISENKKDVIGVEKNVKVCFVFFAWYLN